VVIELKRCRVEDTFLAIVGDNVTLDHLLYKIDGKWATGARDCLFQDSDINLQHQCEHAPYSRVFGQEIYSHGGVTSISALLQSTLGYV